MEKQSLFSICWKKRKYYLYSCGCAIIIACIINLCIPNEYAAQTEISDEHKISMDLSVGLSTVDALMQQAQVGEEGMRDPEVYVQLLKSSTFLGEFLNTRIDKYNMSYYEYLLTKSKSPWWDNLITQRDSSFVLGLLNKKIRYRMATKFSTIKLQVIDNEPDIAALMVDSLRSLLEKKLRQSWIFTNKAELERAKVQRHISGIAYKKAAAKYKEYVQSHTDANIGRDKINIEYLQKEKDDVFKAYNDACIKYNRYLFLIQRNVPYFTTISKPTIPNVVCEPLWGVRIIAYVFIAFVLTTWYILYKNLYTTREK